MRYSKRAQSVIRLANQEAARLDHDHISTGHLLLGLIREGEGTAVAFLKDMDIDLGKMKAELESIMENKGRGAVIGQLKLTETANNALKMAAEESQNMGHKYVGTEHILLGIIHQREGVAAKKLIESGVDLNSVRSAAQTNAVDEEEHTETLTFHDVELAMPTQEQNTNYAPDASQKDVLDLEEASQLLRISVDDLERLLEAEDLPARMISGKWRFSRSALIRWLGEGKCKDYSSMSQ